MKQKVKINFDKELASKIFTIFVAVLLLAAHIVMILLMSKTIRYYSIYPQLFNQIVIILVCLFIIVDIVFFVGVFKNDLIQKIITCVLALLITIGSVYGVNLISKTNNIVDNVVDTEYSEQKMETISGIFVTYDDKYKNIQDVSELKKFNNLKIGYMSETSADSVSSIGLEELSKAGVTGFSKETYTNNTDLLFALIGGKIDVAIFSNMYRAVFRADENVDYTQYLDKMNEFSEFSKEIEVAANTSTKKLSEEPFNVLLIGWSPIIGSTTIGLADAIIVATVNPKTFTVSMMSIARDSYVPISCYGGQCDKINSGRGTSMDCFVSTVENLIHEEIDFYMEINFAGFAELCGELGGIPINNPVSFELDGVYVPAGEYVADGWQALQFARERHHMPNGDFDRQQHQKEVIMQIAKKFLTHSLDFALGVFEEVSDTINTNLTFNQLASVFNLVTNAKNYTGVSTFDTLDMHALRITGYADWHYSDEYELPLWIYRLYDGSISESLDHMQEVMGNYKSMNQNSGFSFNAQKPYERAPFYSLSYDEVEVHETLPPFYKNLTTMTYADALVWASENGATLIPTFIGPKDAGYDESLEGMVVSQSVPYGKKVSKYPTCNIIVMGNGKKKITIPDYSGWSLDRAKLWVKDNEIESVRYVVEYVSSTEAIDNHSIKSIEQSDETIVITYYEKCSGKVVNGVCELSTPENYVGSKKSSLISAHNDTYSSSSDSFTYNGYTYKFSNKTTTEELKVGEVISQSVSGSTVTLYVGTKETTPTGTCEVDVNHATACDDNKFATACELGYKVVNGKCEVDPDYEEEPTTGTCEVDVNHATACDDNKYATACELGYKVVNGKCEVDPDYEEESTTGTCEIEHATVCEDGKATSCEDGYSPVEGVCVAN